MQRELIEYLNNERLGVLSVQLSDGCPHAATVHFAFDEKSFSFIFITSPSYRKCEAIEEGKETPASLVVGVSEEDMKTAQFDGVVTLTNAAELEGVYFKKFPEKIGKHKDDIFLVFKPKEWKYTDWNKPEGKTILDHTGKINIV